MLLKKHYIFVLLFTAALLMVSLIYLAFFITMPAGIVSTDISEVLNHSTDDLFKNGELPVLPSKGEKGGTLYANSENGKSSKHESDIFDDEGSTDRTTAKSDTTLPKTEAPVNREKAGYQTDEVIATIDDWDNIRSFLERHRLQLIDAVGNTLRLKVTGGYSVINEINELNEDSNVSYAEPNYTRYAAYIPDDPYYNNDVPGNPGTKQWGPQKINAPGAWDLSMGSTVTIVAVIDTGVDYNHPELLGRVVLGPDYVNSDGNPMDDNGHGSHVAGIVAASGDNSVGIAGVDWKTKIMALKVLNNAGSGSDFNVAAAVRYAADNGADVINLSLAGSSFSQTLQNAVNYAYGKGVVITAAAGNDGTTAINYPAGLLNVIGVGATDQSDVRASFSNFNSSVDVSAPGVDILSLYSTVLGFSYAQMSGTSMATPHVAGVAALIKSVRPFWSPAVIESRLKQTALDLGVSGRDDYYGFGRIDAYQSLFNTPGLIEIVSFQPTVFDPNAGSMTINLSLTNAANVYLRVADINGNIVRNIGPFAKNAGASNISWDGRNESGVLLQSSWYKLDIFAVNGNESVNRGVTVNLNNGQIVSISAPLNSTAEFNPAAGQSVDISSTTSRDAFLGLVIYDGNGGQMRIFPLRFGKAGLNSFNWDGRDALGNIAPPGSYNYLMIAIDSGGNSDSDAGSVNIVN